MSASNRLGLPLLDAAQAQKHVTHNEALAVLDALVQASVSTRNVTTPPSSPSEGMRVLVGASTTGVFTGHDGALAAFDNGGWSFSTPRAGWRLYVADENVLLFFDGSAWSDIGLAIRSLQNLTGLGVGAASDTTNPFVAKLNSSLFTARPVSDGGTGDVRVVLNKSATANTASHLYQANFSGRAETGLTGTNDFAIKVSADGSAWHTGLSIDATTGAVSFPSGLAGGLATLRNGAGAPYGAASPGDFWIDTTNSRLYGPYAGGVWSSSYVSLVGPAGAAGAAGATGPAGPSAYAGTSTTSLALATGAQTFTTQSGLSYFAGQRLIAAADATHWMEGIVSSYSGTTLALSIDLVAGSGTFAAWAFGPAGQQGAAGLGGIVFSPAYTNTGGQGDRVTGSVVAVTASSGLLVSAASRLVDGSTTYPGNATAFNAISVAGAWLLFDFGLATAKVITEATWAQSSATFSHGTWQWQGSNDATGFTNIGASFTLGGATAQVISTLSANQTGWRYYRLLGVSGTASASPYLQEVTFKIGATALDRIGVLPVGGTTNQVILKKSGTDLDFGWGDAPGTPAGGAINQVLTKKSATSLDLIWADAAGDLFARLPSANIISEWRFTEKTGTTVYDRRGSNNIVFDATFQSTYSAPAPEWTGHGVRLTSSMIQTPSMAGVRTIVMVYRVRRGETAGFILSGIGGSSGTGVLGNAVPYATGNNFWVGGGNGVAPVRFRTDNGAAANRLTRGGYVLLFAEVPSAITMTLGLGGRYGTTTSRCAEFGLVHLATYGGTLSSQDRLDYYNVMRQALLPRGIRLDWRDCLDHVDCVALWGQSNADGRALNTDLSAGQLATRIAHTFIQPGLANGTIWPRPDLLSIGLNQQLSAPATNFGPEIGAMLAREAAGSSRLRDLYISKAPLGSTWLAPSSLGVSGITASNTWNAAEIATSSLLHSAETAWWDMEQALLLRGIGPRLRALWWMQGEQDATSASASTSHQDYLQALYNDAASYLGYPALPIVVGRIRNMDPSMDSTAAANVRSAQASFVSANSPAATMIDTDSYALKSDNVHYNGAGQLALGAAFYGATNFT